MIMLSADPDIVPGSPWENGYCRCFNEFQGRAIYGQKLVTA